ncbi:MAG: MFS transporter [Bryobacteraceae bacterium]
MSHDSSKSKLPVTSEPSEPESPYPNAGYAWYVVGVLTLVYVFSFIDRQILSLLVRPIRRDLGITDTQMSLLMGFTFAVFYTFFGIPLGRLADSRSRRGLVAWGFALWSLFTAGCGLVRNFGQMLLCRVGVGVGEAALSPSAYSLISDYFPPDRRSTALSVYGAGIYLGSGLAFFLGGIVVNLASGKNYLLPLLGEIRGWQMIFFLVGLPGLLLAPLLLTVREPVRRGVRVGAEKLSLSEVASYVKENLGTFLCHNFGFAFISFTTYAAAAWIPTYFVRHFALKEGSAGISFGMIVTTAGVLGVIVGGRVADWMRSRGIVDANLRVPLYAILLELPIGIGFLLTQDLNLAMVLLFFSTFLTSAPFGCAPAAIQQIMPNNMRAQASSLYLFVNNIIGIGLGPTAVALFTEKVFHDDAAVGQSLLWTGVMGKVTACVLLAVGLAQIRKSVERLKVYLASH